MSVKFSNNAKTTLSSGITSSATSITVADGSVFPSISGSEYFYVTLEDASANIEIVKVTAVSGNTLTVVRAQDGTSARTFSSGDKCELRLTAAGLNDVATQADTDTTYTAGSGLSLTGTEFANTAPDQTVALTGAGATTVSGAYPNFTITSTDTNTDTTYTAGTGITLTGTEFSIGQDVATTASPAFVNLTLSGTGSVKVPSGTTAQRDGSPANGMFRYNSTTEEFEGYSDGQWGSIGGSSNLNIDTMTGDGSDTTLTLSINPTVENNTQVYIDGVYQNKDTYSVSGTTLTFSTAPPAGSAVEVMTITPSVVSLHVPADGSVTPAKIASGDFYFDTNTLYVDSTNNRVGIGTASPATALDTNGIVRASSAYSLSYAGVDGSTSAFGAGTISADANWGMFFKSTTGASVAEFAWVNAAGSERMRIDSSGQVGIGTSSPSETLHMFKATYPIFKIESTSYNSTLGIDTGNGNLVLNNVSNAGLLFNTNNTERMRIDPAGKVGIGTTTPSYALSVKGLGSSTVPASFESSGSSSWLMLKDSGTTLGNVRVGSSSNALVQYAGGAERMRIDSAGSLLVGKTTSAGNVQGFVAHGSGSLISSVPSGNTYHVKNTNNDVFTFYVGYTGGIYNYQSLNVNLSDEREKKNIEPLESKWDSVKSWSLKTFHYNHQADESTKNYGVIAQDVEQTNPEAIDAYQKDENTERKGVKEQQMMWMAIKALQEAQTRIETLETRIAALEE